MSRPGMRFAALGEMLVRTWRIWVFVATAALLPALSGCTHAVSFDESAPMPPSPSEPMRGGPYRYRTFTSPSVLALQSEEMLSPEAAAMAGMPWWTWRNDIQPTTYAGYASPVYEAFSSYTFDQQTTNGPCVRDYYYQSTYRLRAGTAAQ